MGPYSIATTMDVDLLADALNEGQTAISGNLLSRLPDRSLTNDEPAAQASNFISRSPGAGDASQAGVVVSKIEDIFEKITSCLLDENKDLVIELKTRGKQAAKKRDAGRASKSVPDEEVRSVRFPNKSPKEAWKFTALLRILELSHEALVAGTVTTKRDMFYRDPELFIKQAVVDRYVDDLAYTLGVERHAMNVVAAAKGLVTGSFKLMKNDGSVVNYTAELEGLLVPSIKDIKGIQMLNIEWILVVEKEATFRTLATIKYWDASIAGRGIIITAKGYPDIQTRQFLRFLSISFPTIPIFALVDFDPDGIGIMSTYKYGSVTLSHENQSLAVPSIRWLGVRSSDIIQDETDKTGLLKLSERDRRIATRMLEKEVFGEDPLAGGCEREWRRELQVMLTLNCKAEIQILSSGKKLEGWLDRKLARAISN